MAKLDWKRTKLTNAAWFEAIAKTAGGGYFIVRGTGTEYVAGYHTPRERRHNYVRIGTATNVPDAVAIAQADYERRSADD